MAMLGFGKKNKDKKDTKKKEKTPPSDKEKAKKAGTNEPPKGFGAKIKGLFSLKLIIVVLLLLIAFGGSGFVVYKFYLAPQDPGAQIVKYTKTELEYIKLPEEMIKFCFDHFPDLYRDIIRYNTEIKLILSEIERIDAVGIKYPDQKKIAENEKKIWTKAKVTLEKSFKKIEKPVKETFVLYQVNNELGLAQVEAKNDELVTASQEAINAVQELTQKLKTQEVVPEGFINGTLYKLKKLKNKYL